MTLSARAIAQSVFAIERALDLQAPAWREDDVHWWPLYRTELYRLLFTSAAGKPSRAVARVRPALQRARFERQPAASHTVWLVSDGISYARVGEREVERFCTPLRAGCDALGIPALVVDRGRADPPVTAEPARWVAPWTVRAKVAATLASRTSRSQRHRDLVAAVVQAAHTAGVPLPALSAQRMQALAGAVLLLARRVERSLRREQVRAVFVVGFYDVSGYAFTLAAARAGIPSVDVQHGVTGPYHLAYTDWPASGAPWRLLPRWFWTWTAADADLISRWAPHGTHTAICGGHPFLDAWREGRMQLDVEQQAQLEALVARGGRAPAVLVTLQPHLTHEEALKPLLDAMHLNPDAKWWLRLHPMALTDRAALETLLATRGLSRCDIDCSTHLPLPALLTRAAVHATHSSSAFVEAAAVGLPSIVWSSYGAELAEDDVRAGSAHAALDGAAFSRLLSALTQAPSRPPPSTVPAGAAALCRILEIAA